MGWRGWKRCVPRVVGGGPGHKKKLYLRSIHCFVLEKYVEDAKQDEKHVPDLLESIMRPTCLVKEELRLILFKLTQFRPEILRIKVSTFWIPEI